MIAQDTLLNLDFSSLPLFKEGKVRSVFDFNEHLVYEWDAAEDEFKPIKEEQTILS